MDDSISARHTTLAGAVGLFGFFAGLCAVFALAVTLVEWRTEHAEAQWPLTTARIERADLGTRALRYRVRYVADWQERCDAAATGGGER